MSTLSTDVVANERWAVVLIDLNDLWKHALTLVLGSGIWAWIAKALINREVKRNDDLHAATKARLDDLDKAREKRAVEIALLMQKMDAFAVEQTRLFAKLDAASDRIEATNERITASIIIRSHRDNEISDVLEQINKSLSGGKL